jgi:hypothetical protein
MTTAQKSQGSRVTSWLLKLLMAVILGGIGYKSRTLWLTTSVTVWAAYCLALLTAPLLVAATQNTRIAATAKWTLATLGTLAVAALLSAPVVLLYWFR